MKKTCSFFSKIFSLDLRSLGLFRITLGSLLMIDGLQKFYWARDFYSDWGLMPRAYWIENYMNVAKFSFHLAMGETWFQRALILVQVLAALCYTLGLHTRIAGVVTFVLLCSLQSRNYLVLSSADELMRMALFWSLFLPIHARFAWKHAIVQGDSAKGWFTVPFIFQLIFIYEFTAILKMHPIWTKEFSAVYYALNIDMYSKPLGRLLRQSYPLTQFFTISTLILEYVGPILAFIPGITRGLVALAFIGFHFGLFTTLEIGLFPWMAMVYWIAFIPGSFWEFSWGRKLSSALEVGVARLARSSLTVLPWKQFRWEIWFSGCAFFLVVWQNLDSIKVPLCKRPAAVVRVTDFLNLHQIWDMFAPYPIRNDGWFIIEGKFKDGSQRDLMTGLPKTFAQPESLSAFYPTSEWRKFMLHVWDDGNSRILLPYARYLCRRYSDKNGEPVPLELISIDFMKKPTPPPGEPWQIPAPVHLWNHDCFK